VHLDLELIELDHTQTGVWQRHVEQQGSHNVRNSEKQSKWLFTANDGLATVVFAAHVSSAIIRLRPEVFNRQHEPLAAAAASQSRPV